MADIGQLTEKVGELQLQHTEDSTDQNIQQRSTRRRHKRNTQANQTTNHSPTVDQPHGASKPTNKPYIPPHRRKAEDTANLDTEANNDNVPHPLPKSGAAQSLNANARAFKPQTSKKYKQTALDGSFGHPSTANGNAFPPQPWNSYGLAGKVTSPRRSARITNQIPTQHYGNHAQYSHDTASFDTNIQPSFDLTRNATKISMPRPQPSEAYLKQANQAPTSLHQRRPLLVVLDLNGTLLRRNKHKTNAIYRPRVHEFLHYLFKEHNVLIWSSMKPYNVEKYCKDLLSEAQRKRVIACWDRKMLRIPAYAYNQNVQTYKQLSWIWKDKQIQSMNPNPMDYWSQDNTVLIDDSSEKAASEPHSIIELEEFEGRKDQKETDVLGNVVKYLETLRWQRDVSAYIRSTPFASGSEEPFDWTSIVGEMS